MAVNDHDSTGDIIDAFKLKHEFNLNASFLSSKHVNFTSSTALEDISMQRSTIENLNFLINCQERNNSRL